MKFEVKSRMGDVNKDWEKATSSALIYITEVEVGYLERAVVTTPAKFWKFLTSYKGRGGATMIGRHSDGTTFIQSCAYPAPGGTEKKVNFGKGKLAYWKAWLEQQVTLADLLTALDIDPQELNTNAAMIAHRWQIKPTCDGYNGILFECAIRYTLAQHGLCEYKLDRQMPPGKPDIDASPIVGEAFRSLVFGK